MSTLLLGDSHTDIFYNLNLSNVNRFDMRRCQTGVFTVHRFVNPQDTDLWNQLSSWFQEHTISSTTPATSLVITSGEIDIRAHYWKHIVRNYNTVSDIQKYIHSTVLKFYNTLVQVSEKYNLKKIVVWAPPTAGDRAQYNSVYPFCGPAQTRNQLIHLWHTEFANIINNDIRISLSSAYYDFINPDTYLTVSPAPTPDGVHWNWNFGPMCWNTLILPALSKKGLYVGTNWHKMYNDQFEIAEQDSLGTQQYDTWARTDQIENISIIDRQVEILNQSYSWVRAAHRSLLPKQYRELSLKKI